MDVGFLKHCLEQLPNELEVFIPSNTKNPSKGELCPALCLTHDGNKIVISPVCGDIDADFITRSTIESFQKDE